MYTVLYTLYFVRKGIIYSMLYTFNETFTSALSYDILIVISIAAVLCAIFVIISKNPIVSVLYLIGLFLNIAIYLIMLGINFIGLSYLLVYVGAVSILFLFILMLINVRISELVTDNYNSIPLAVMICVFFTLTLYKVFPDNYRVNTYMFYVYEKNMFKPNKDIDLYNMSSIVDWNINNQLSYFLSLMKEMSLKNNLYYVTTQIWDGALEEFSHITSIGNVLYTVYPLWLILTSLILLLAMVGAIVITIKQ